MLKTLMLAIVCLAAALAVGFTFAVLATIAPAHAQQYSGGGATYNGRGQESGRYYNGSDHAKRAPAESYLRSRRGYQQGSRPDAYPYRGGTWMYRR